jgi:dolichol-phosphate mannosyltransferase
MPKTLISIVITAYNEAACINALTRRLTQVFDSLPKYNFEALVVDNGSTDNTYTKLLDKNKQDRRFKIIKLSRNFGAQGGITAGLQSATGEAAILMCADLQDTPELIPSFLKKWEEGYDNVYGIVKKRIGTNIIRRTNAKIFYWILENLTGNLIPRNASGYTLIDKKIYTLLNHMHERNRMIRGLIAWAGFKSIGIEYDRENRHAGNSKASTLVVLKLAIHGIFGFSYIPLRIATFLGGVISICSFTMLLILTGKFLLFGVPFPGFGTIVSLMLLLFGFLFVLLGIIGEYIAMIFEEAKGRPNFVVSEKIGVM